MENARFTAWLRQAKTLRSLSAEPEQESFWRGYIRGLREAHHGDNRGKTDEHERYLRIAEDEPDTPQRELGRGYRAGFAQVDPARLSDGGTMTKFAPAEKTAP